MPPRPDASLHKTALGTQADRHFLSMAYGERASSDDPKAKLVPQSGVGVVIVKDGIVVSRSANVLPPALKTAHVENERGVSEAERYHFIEHAERAAIMMALSKGKSLDGATLYCTRFACSDCARAIIWSGIQRVVFGSGLAEEVRWLEAQQAAEDMLRLAKIKVEVVAID